MNFSVNTALASRKSRFSWLRRTGRTALLSSSFGRTQQYGFPIFKPRGALDFYCCGDFLKALQSDVDGRHRTIAVDLSRVSSLDLSVAWLLFTIHQYLQAHQRRLLLLDASPSVQETLRSAWERLSA